MTTYETYTVKVDDYYTVARIVWERFRRPMIGMTERVLELNPGIAGLGPILPRGTVITLPIDPPPRSNFERPVVQLWD